MTDVLKPAPLRRPLAVASVPAEGLAFEIVADEAERESLAAANDLPSVQSFVARLDVRPVGRDGLSARGTLTAQATRICVVTLEPFVETLREEMELRFSGGAVGQHAGEDDDPPDPIVGGEVDLGAAACEFFTLGLNPHPRKPGAEFDDSVLRDDAASPFAALAALKGGRGET